MKIIEVCAAIIVKENRIFVTQRGYGDFKDMWEFPGGKIEPGETKNQCIIREIKEELNADIEVLKFLKTVDYDYEKFHLTMHCLICKLKNDHIDLLEHEAAKWVSSKDLEKVEFLPADLLILPEINHYLSSL